ncbi:hypothetical protein EDD86DRAFT_211356 [Gorgonomyces haynaldii]|nr:hypothetical protein EDD86DRAFT_211356 [Gorgonomyces haynaldii]
MKFGKFIQGVASEWAEPHYINYKGLKKIITSVEQSMSSSLQLAAFPPNTDALSQQQNLKITFFYRLERELEKVNSFYLQKETELKVRSQSLMDKKRVIMSMNPQLALQAALKLKQAFLQFQQDLQKLLKFVQVNATGFRKILKKFDKRAKSTTKELYLVRQIDIQPVFNNDFLTAMSDMVSNELQALESFIDSLKERATQDLQEERPTAEHVESDLSTMLLESSVDSLAQILSKFTLQDTHLLSRLLLRHCTETSIECVQALLNTKSIDINYSDDINFRTVLHESVIAGRLDLVQLFVKNGASTKAIDLYGKTPLHYCCFHGHLHICEYLLSLKVELDPLDHDGNTPLIQAISSGYTQICVALVNAGVNINAITPHSSIPLCLSCDLGNDQIVSLLLQKQAHVIPTSEGMYPIHLASRRGHVKILQQLIDNGHDIEIKDNFYSWTPLFFSSQEGHFQCVDILLKAGAIYDQEDPEGWLPLTYAFYHSHMKIADLLGSLPSKKQQDAPAEPKSEIDDIPSLSLPPPIIPLRIYGHKYLDKQSLLTLHFVSQDNIVLYNRKQLNSLKLQISSVPDNNVPFTVILPFADDTEPFNFMVDQNGELSIVFDIYPTFGSHLIARGVLLMDQIKTIFDSNINGSNSSDCIIVPLIDTHLKTVGKLQVGCSIITPFPHASLSIGGRIETYWKASQIVPGHGKMESHNSFITASSLSEEYIELVVQMTRDEHLVVYADWHIETDQMRVAISSLTLKEAQSLFKRQTDPTNSVDQIYGNLYTLEDALKILPPNVGASILLQHPSATQRVKFDILKVPNVNAFVDQVLQTVYEHGNHRSVIYCSTSKQVCLALNWKQPNYGVFFCSSGGFGNTEGISLKESVKFAKESNLLGLIFDAHPLVRMPRLIKHIKESGLLLVSAGRLNLVPENVKLQEKHGLDATIVKRVFKYNMFS